MYNSNGPVSEEIIGKALRNTRYHALQGRHLGRMLLLGYPEWRISLAMVFLEHQ